MAASAPASARQTAALHVCVDVRARVRARRALCVKNENATKPLSPQPRAGSCHRSPMPLLPGDPSQWKFLESRLQREAVTLI